MLKKTILVFIIIIISTQLQFGQKIIAPSNVKWYTINEAFELAKKDPRPILVDVYTDWCSWCGYMMKTTFSNKQVSDYINNNFYAAKFNAETLDTVYFDGEKYFNRQIGRRPANDLTINLLNGNLTYPSLVFFDRNGEKTVVHGYKEAKDIEPYLVYFAEDLIDKITIDKFIVNFMFSFPLLFEKDHSIFHVSNSVKPDTTGKVNWEKPESITLIKKKKRKPILLYLYADWSYSSIVMEKTSLQNRELAEKINDYYSPVKVNISESQVNFLGQNYNLDAESNINQIAERFLNNNLVFPALLVFDENHNLVTTITGYFQKQQLLPLTDYYYNKIYKKQTLREYFKSFMTIASHEKENKVEN